MSPHGGRGAGAGRLVLLDLDGTISDNSAGIVAGARLALDAVGVRGVDDAQIVGHIGPPLRSMFTELGVAADDVEAAVAAYRDHYRTVGLFENVLYDGIVAAIDELAAAGHRLAVATSKPEVFARRIIEHFGLADRFAHVGGASLDGTVQSKADVVRATLAATGASPETAHHAVMVGDRRHDVEGARSAGVASCIGVLWGFGDEAELRGAGASVLVERPAELAAAVAGLA